MNTIKKVPRGAWDSHCHVFENKTYTFAPGRHFTPGTATLSQLQALHSSVGVENVCITHGFAYGTDCSSLLDYMQRYEGQVRGICVLDIDGVTDGTLDNYHDAGIRSVRLNFVSSGAMQDLEKQITLIRTTASRLEQWWQRKQKGADYEQEMEANRLGSRIWSIQIQQPEISHWPALTSLAAELPTPLVIDHFALIQAPSIFESTSSTADQLARDLASINDVGFSALLEGLRDGNLYVKFSAPYRCSNDQPRYDDLETAVRAMIAANPDRVLWGSDWPHTQRHHTRKGKDPTAIEPFQRIDNSAWIESLSRWMSEEQWFKMWVLNPRRLYDGHAE
jgi:predicted TIM-barrel fold metal-dependent hydrolase